MHDGYLQAIESPGANPAPTRIRRGLVLLLFAAGAALCVAAFLADGSGWENLGPTALLEIGIAVGLVGVLLILERSLVGEIRRGRPKVRINCDVRREGQGSSAWDTWTEARPDDTLEFLIRFENSSDRTLKNVIVGDNLPKYLCYVDGSTELRNGAFPSGVSIESDNIAEGGIDVGHYEPGAVGYVLFAARTNPVSAYKRPGTYDIRNVGIVRAEGVDEHYNVAKVLLDVRIVEAA